LLLAVVLGTVAVEGRDGGGGGGGGCGEVIVLLSREDPCQGRCRLFLIL